MALDGQEVVPLSSPTTQKPAARVSRQMERAHWHAVGLWSLIVFALLNLGCWRLFGEEKAAKRDLWTGSGSIDLLLDDFAKLSAPPDIVLIGSSLVMYPFWAMDKQDHPAVGGIFQHHTSFALADALAQGTSKRQRVFSFATFGQMISDAYIYVHEYLKGERLPSYLVFGIAPRDFSDYDLPNPMETMTFKRLVGLANFAKYQDIYLPSWQDKLEFLLDRSCFFYAKRWRLQKEVEKALAKAYSLSGISSSGICAQGQQGGFMLAGTTEERWQSSLQEYRRRYRNIGERDLSVQLGFLRRLLELCRSRSIKVVVVNMPLTQVNRDLFPPGFYERFCNGVARITRDEGGRFLDLGAAKAFQPEDFWDTTHLNHAGGRKLLRCLVPELGIQR